ncbi:DUF1127 domain-containing protein [Paroceanicella profunda]|uniref:DUF1127 domain-containing protein n=1 Tax=Paroceanicella profunda TaxID=2579971 RepID=A0A5B8G188_9RHOB|nr:DUF1127 domain-containing protein [Paroceanicella profunda]QDL92822.1 DUF1127 domain-containing protein [Paroceanicella profunda]
MPVKSSELLALDLGAQNRLPVLADVLVRFARLTVVWTHRARTRRSLAQMDETRLADIGITREMALIEAAKPFWRA